MRHGRSDGYVEHVERVLQQLLPMFRTRDFGEAVAAFVERALQLLAEDHPSLGPTLADGGELRADLRQMLGGSRYFELLRELIH